VRIGRRPLFFLLLATINLALLPATPSEFRFVNVVMAGIALLWSVLLALEELATQRRRERDGRRPSSPVRRV